METILRPARFLMEEFGADVTLVYGDIEGSDLVLRSNHPLREYSQEGEVYAKSLDIDKDVKNHWYLFSSPQGRKIPGEVKYDYLGKLGREIQAREDEFQMDFFGVEGSYGYVASVSTIRALASSYHQNKLLANQVLGEFLVETPRDIILAHEGTHVVLFGYKETLEQNQLLVPPYLRPETTRIAVLSEAVPMWAELKYASKHYPESVADLHNFRLRSDYYIYAEAYRLATEKPDEIAEIVAQIKERQMAIGCEC